MTTKRYCDFCGNECTDPPYEQITLSNKRTITISYNAVETSEVNLDGVLNTPIISQLDICYKCVTDFAVSHYQLLERKKEANNGA